jgi:hypothetical protein
MIYQYSWLSSSTTTHVVTWWGTISFSPHCQTAPESDLRWTVDRTRRPSQLACTISWPQSSGILAVGTPKRLWCIQRRSMTWRYYSNELRMPVRRFEWTQEFSAECAPLCDKELKVVLKCVGTTRSICCGDHTNIAHISAGIHYSTYVKPDVSEESISSIFRTYW